MTPGLPASAYGGAVSRLTAYVVDLVVLSVLVAGGSAVTAFLVEVVTGHDLDVSGDRGLAGTGLGVAWFVYFAASWAIAGRTVGMGLLGLKVVRPDGTRASATAAVVRTAAFPLSMALFGLGFLGIVFHSQRRALHDLIAGTAVVYSPVQHVAGPPPGPEAGHGGAG